MWLITPIGFFSVVQKPSDIPNDTLTIRARVKSDLDALRQTCLPSLGAIQTSSSNDYRYRAVAPRDDVAQAMANMVAQLSYSNFKNEVAKRQGHKRAHVYHGVWDVLYQLQAESAGFEASQNPKAQVVHPCLNEKGQSVVIKRPHLPSSLGSWLAPTSVACVTPGGDMPSELNGVSFDSSMTHEEAVEWALACASHPVPEPDFPAPLNSKRSAGVVIQEPDGRVWVVAPTNQFGGYSATFPKGTVEKLGPTKANPNAGVSNGSMQATAVIEAFEESGLKVKLIRHLVDCQRSTGYARYYLAERIGGHPAMMGWESQAVMLVPVGHLKDVITHANDLPIIRALTVFANPSSSS